jgi:2-keto-4-pentenoate hydratase/2-oxohepta-3-ene-1,7-dioic acid hydratase in catechol pathway
MRVLRFTPKPGGELGNDPLFGLLEDDEKTISVVNGDPLFNGIQKSGQLTSLDEVRLLAPVLPRSKVVCIGKNTPNMPKRWVAKFQLSQ